MVVNFIPLKIARLLSIIATIGSSLCILCFRKQMENIIVVGGGAGGLELVTYLGTNWGVK